MNEIDRIMLECRYLLSLNKDYSDLAKLFNTTKEIIYYDLNILLPTIDSILYKRVNKVLNENNCS